MADKVKETAVEEIHHITSLTRDAVRSGAYWYPLKGIAYYSTHRTLWKPLMAKLAPTLGLGVGVLSFMFVFTYVPQAAVLAVFNGPLAALTTVLLVFSESSTIFNVLSKNFLIDDALIDTFDGTLLARHHDALVARERRLKPSSDPIGRMGKVLATPFQRFTPKAIIRYFLYLPLNFIPVVGTVIFIYMQGKKFGPVSHARYFQLKGMSKSQREEFIKKRHAAYTSFGVSATLLEMVPFAGIFFTFTNTVGAALWAADLETKEGTTAQGLRNTAELAEGQSTGVTSE